MGGYLRAAVPLCEWALEAAESRLTQSGPGMPLALKGRHFATSKAKCQRFKERDLGVRPSPHLVGHSVKCKGGKGHSISLG